MAQLLLYAVVGLTATRLSARKRIICSFSSSGRSARWMTRELLKAGPTLPPPVAREVDSSMV